jgi:hypothetical protein
MGINPSPWDLIALLPQILRIAPVTRVQRPSTIVPGLFGLTLLGFAYYPGLSPGAFIASPLDESPHPQDHSLRAVPLVGPVSGDLTRIRSSLARCRFQHICPDPTLGPPFQAVAVLADGPRIPGFVPHRQVFT